MENVVKHVWEEEDFDLTNEIRNFEEIVREVKKLKVYTQETEAEHAESEKADQEESPWSPRKDKLDRLLDLIGSAYRDTLLRRAEGLELEVTGYILLEWLRERPGKILALSKYAEIGQGVLSSPICTERILYVNQDGVASTSKHGRTAPKTHRHDFDEVLKDLMMEQQELK